MSYAKYKTTILKQKTCETLLQFRSSVEIEWHTFKTDTLPKTVIKAIIKHKEPQFSENSNSCQNNLEC